eukprot:gnl/Spiro4/800_TR439_c0_g1_i1.p2 gnl/Spiro4/800_TR439_c0_g1~~gnl/Spiro4/800_TR439_c0_g1_i1.p2  ORF type:complete len:122 (-),score=4.84 gnl/Spiro4/800_TR439_c0_g1_i1:441-806(-)
MTFGTVGDVALDKIRAQPHRVVRTEERVTLVLRSVSFAERHKKHGTLLPVEIDIEPKQQNQHEALGCGTGSQTVNTTENLQPWASVSVGGELCFCARFNLHFSAIIVVRAFRSISYVGSSS